MAIIIWIMIELYLIVNELREKYSISINVFNIDETGGLKPLSAFILLIVSSYFIFITLFMIETLRPIDFYNVFARPIPITYPMIILILMLLLDVFFFIITQ